MVKVITAPNEKKIKKAELIVTLHENGLSYAKIAHNLGKHVTWIYALKKWYKEVYKKGK